MYSDQDKAEILVDALPYIQEFYGTTVVIKYGGNAMINDALKENVMRDVALMKFVRFSCMAEDLRSRASSRR